MMHDLYVYRGVLYARFACKYMLLVNEDVGNARFVCKAVRMHDLYEED